MKSGRDNAALVHWAVGMLREVVGGVGVESQAWPLLTFPGSATAARVTSTRACSTCAPSSFPDVMSTRRLRADRTVPHLLLVLPAGSSRSMSRP